MKPRLSVPARITGIQRMQSVMNMTEKELHQSRVERVVMYRCEECGELHDWESDAEKCCAITPPCSDNTAHDCPICGQHFETARDASDCCLWHDIDAHARWAIADAVEAGSTWADELNINPYGLIQ